MCDQQTALDELRVLKTRLNVEITTDGRETGQNITFYSEDNPTAPTYEEYKLRRKAEILKYDKKNGNSFSTKHKYSMIMQGKIKNNLSRSGNKTFILTQSNKNNYTRSNGTLILTNSKGVCTSGSVKLPGTNSNIPVSNDELFYLDDDVPYLSQL